MRKSAMWNVLGCVKKMNRKGELPKGGLIVYGVGAHLNDMLTWHKDLAERIIRVIDKDTTKIGKKASGVACKVESPEVLEALPAGSLVVVSALRYYDEVVKELHELNPGLVCTDIDRAYISLKQAEVKGMLVYGVGAHLADMLSWHPELKDRIGRIFDKDQKKQEEQAPGTDKLVEGLGELKRIPAGTKIAVSAIRYLYEIAAEVYELNPGLICQSIDDAYGRLTTPSSAVFECRYDISTLHQKKYIGVITTKYCLYIAELLKDNISMEGFNCEIFIGTDKLNFESEQLYIVICPQMYKCLPQNYIAFQLEQSVSPMWFDDEYIIRLKKAIAIFEYSLTNIEYLQKHGIPFSKIFYIPISPNGKVEKRTNHKYEYDVLFYGDINSERRKKFLDKIQEKFDIKIISNLFGEELKRKLGKARIVVNIHYYENAILETTRISEVLSLGTSLIVSERSSEANLDEQFEDCVDFVDVNNVDMMIERLEFWLSDLNRLESKVQSVNANRKDVFSFYFKRFIMTKGWMSSDGFF